MYAKTYNSKLFKKFSFCRANDFATLMYPCIFLSLICAVFPYKIEASRILYSPIRFFCSTIVVILCTGFVCMYIYVVDFAGILEINIPLLLQANSYTLLCSTICVLTYILTGARLKVLQKLAKLSERLSPKTFDQLARWIHLKDVIGFVFVTIYIPCTSRSSKWPVTFMILSTYYTALVFLMDMLYMNCVCVVKACFGKLNERLINLKEIIITEEPHLLRRVYQEQKNPLLLIELRALKRCHLQISYVVTILNRTFGLQIVATVVLTFLEATFSLYFFIVAQLAEKEMPLEKRIWYSTFILSVIYYSIKLTLMVWACETGNDQALQIGTNVHEVLINTFDKRVRDELELFSLQVLHHENVFSAKLFTMDATLLTQIVGAITTYILILMQFLLSSASAQAVLVKNSTNEL